MRLLKLITHRFFITAFFFLLGYFDMKFFFENSPFYETLAEDIIHNRFYLFTGSFYSLIIYIEFFSDDINKVMHYFYTCDWRRLPIKILIHVLRLLNNSKSSIRK